MLIDTHCHLNFQAFNKDLDQVIKRAQNAGVKKIIIPGTDILSSQKAINIANLYPGTCFAAIGIHPHHAQAPDFLVNNDLKKQLENLIKKGSRKVVAIGETGLDFHVYQKTKYEKNLITDEIKLKQKELLLMQMDLGLIHDLPIIFHCREAWPDMLQIVINANKNISRIASPKSRYNRDEGGHNFPTKSVKTNYIKEHQGVFHCFSGSSQELQLLITMGYYIGFDGNITYSDDYSTLISQTPLNRILLETDAPYLSPVPFRGQRNEPQYLSLVAQKISDYSSTPVSKVIHLSTINAQELFKI